MLRYMLIALRRAEELVDVCLPVESRGVSSDTLVVVPWRRLALAVCFEFVVEIVSSCCGSSCDLVHCWGRLSCLQGVILISHDWKEESCGKQGEIVEVPVAPDQESTLMS